MDDSLEGKEKSRLPAQQAHQPQPVLNVEEEGWPVQNNETSKKVNSVKKLGSAEPHNGEAPAVDDARFTAGIVRFYETLLNEPVPGKMLKLVEELAKRERKS